MRRLVGRGLLGHLEPRRQTAEQARAKGHPAQHVHVPLLLVWHLARARVRVGVGVGLRLRVRLRVGLRVRLRVRLKVRLRVKALIGGHRRARVVVEARGERERVQPVVGRIAPAPAESVRQLARLRAHQPAVPAREARPQPPREGEPLLLAALLRAAIEQPLEPQHERGRVGVLPVLRHELGGHARLRLRPQDLLARYPAVAMHEVHPVREHVVGDGGLPHAHEQLVEAVVPQEAAREEGARGHDGEQRRGARAACSTPRGRLEVGVGVKVGVGVGVGVRVGVGVC